MKNCALTKEQLEVYIASVAKELTDDADSIENDLMEGNQLLLGVHLARMLERVTNVRRVVQKWGYE